MRRHSVDFFFTICLFLLFTVVGLTVVTMGASVYRQTASAMTNNYDVRTSLLYIMEKIRQNDGNVTVIQTDLGEQIVLHRTYESEPYETHIFCAKGSLKEVTVAAGTEVGASDGQKIMNMAKLALDLEQSLLTIAVTGESGKIFQGKILLEEELP